MTTIPKIYHVRETVGTAAAGFVTDLYSPREAIKEGVSNAYSWTWLALKSGQLKNLDKPIRINLRTGRSPFQYGNNRLWSWVGVIE